MASEARTIEISDVGDLGALVEELRRSRTSRILRQDGEDVAVLTPLTRAVPPKGARPGRRVRPATAEAIARSQAGIRAAAGSWRDVDTERLKSDLRLQRTLVTRPPLEL